MNKTTLIRSLVASLVLALSMAAVSAESLWTAREVAEIDGFAELEGRVVLKFKDAISGAPVPRLSVEVGGTAYEADAQGLVELPPSLVKGVMDQDLPFSATAPGYMTLDDSLRIRLGTILSKRFVMAKGILANQARFVLEWDGRPADLDAHLVGPGFHVSYRKAKSSSKNAVLDRDAQRGYGPETITLLDVKRDGEYVYSVTNYSGEAPMRNVKITVYVDGALHRVVFLSEIKTKSVSILKITKGILEFGS